MNKSIAVGIVSTNSLFVESFELLIKKLKNFVIVTKSSGYDLESLDSLNPKLDVIIVEISGVLEDKVRVIKFISENYSDVKCIAISNDEAPETVYCIMEAGAKAFLPTNINSFTLKETIIEVLNSGFAHQRFIIDKLISVARDNKSSLKKLNTGALTHREIEFILHCCEDLEYKEIASLMKVSPRTIDGYRETVFNKLGIKSRTGIVLYALESGLFKTK